MQDIKQQEELFEEIRQNFWKEYKDINSKPKIDLALKKAFKESISLAVEQEKDRIVELLEKELPINLKEVLDLINNN